MDEYGWYEAGETMPITDGDEVWIVEAYGNKMWAAWRVPTTRFSWPRTAPVCANST
ncbi:C69 family dipeptidase [Pyramidobacter sp. YE332]|uniref:C69 family dipeptidase n=1 Tax=Pyramidobacter sp. YE332 TaxID=3068894 RepID=UPI00294B5EFE|nr:C69 family dipeptidase [Pyramidobacter sp. YE332]WOL41335.1 C69 family dipeptidase [Pyramidobacter sp. YE332]